MMWKRNVVIGVLIGLLGSVCCRVTVRPQNTVGIRGERTSLECRTTEGSIVREWSFSRSSNSQKSEIIFSNWNPQSQFISQRFGVDIDGFGSGILYTNETQFDDAGTYTCSAFTGEEIVKFSAEVIVLEAKPVCSVREYNAGSIKTECSVGFSGNWAPKMEWRHHSRREEAHDAGTTFTSGIDYRNNRTHVTSKLDAVIINIAKDSFSVSCKTFFDARDHIRIQGGSATNVPDFVDIWTFPAFGSTDSVPDVDAALTTPRLDVVVSSTRSGQSTGAIQSKVSYGTESGSQGTSSGNGDGWKNETWYWTLILVGGGVLAITLISILIATTVCVVCKRKVKEQPEGNVNVIYRKKTSTANDSNIYDSIVLTDENGYRIPLRDSIEGDSRIECLPRGSVDPYYVTTLTKQSSSNEAETILKSDEMKEAKATRHGSRKQEPVSPKLSDAKCNSAGNDKVPANYLQLIGDSEDAKVREKESPSHHSGETSPVHFASYTPLVRHS